MGKQRRKPVELRFSEVSPARGADAAASQRERATLLRELGDALGEDAPAVRGSPDGSTWAHMGDADEHDGRARMEDPLTSVTWNPLFRPDAHNNAAPPPSAPSARALRAANRNKAAGGPLGVRHTHATSKQRAHAILKRIDRLQAQEQVLCCHSLSLYATTPPVPGFADRWPLFLHTVCVRQSHTVRMVGEASWRGPATQENSERWEQMVGELKQGRLALGDAVALKALELHTPGELEALDDAPLLCIDQ